MKILQPIGVVEQVVPFENNTLVGVHLMFSIFNLSGFNPAGGERICIKQEISFVSPIRQRFFLHSPKLLTYFPTLVGCLRLLERSRFVCLVNASGDSKGCS